MIVSNDMVSKVKRAFNLNMYESRLWLALLTKGVSSAGELSELANVPRSRAYDVLESLEAKGVVAVKRESRPLKYLAIPLDKAVENSKTYAKKVANQKKTKLEELKTHDMTEQLTELFNKGASMNEKTEHTGILRGRENVMHHTNLMINSAKKDVHIIASPGEAAFIMDHHYEAIKSAKSRGVNVTIGTTGKMPKELQASSNVKKSSINSRMVIKDDNEVLLMLFPHKEMHEMYDAGVWVTSPYFGAAMKGLLQNALK